ncbi:MAG: hypothetical protein JOY82_11735 [Streptosporangiaceae bacterium]|nr:hypothetical protein [Streptosporangiaceae bacterium]MBV9855169.1 hypothetical protein [Streptosporangiaceae bacterium]
MSAHGAELLARAGPDVIRRAQACLSSCAARRSWPFRTAARGADVADGSTSGEAAVLQRGFVNHAGQVPG